MKSNIPNIKTSQIYPKFKIHIYVKTDCQNRQLRNFTNNKLSLFFFSCPRDHSIEIVNGNYGRFTITLCNNKVTPSHCLCFVLSIHLIREPKTGQSTATLSLRWLTWLVPATAGSPAPSVRRPSPSRRTPARAHRGTSRRTTSALPTKVNFD